MTDPASIATWYRVHPQRHAAMLRYWLRSKAYESFWPAIIAARELV